MIDEYNDIMPQPDTRHARACEVLREGLGNITHQQAYDTDGLLPFTVIDSKAQKNAEAALTQADTILKESQ